MKYYVVSDVHSYYTQMREALKDAGFFEETEPCKLIVCGDLLDRGPEAKQMIEFMSELLAEDRLILIRGNHEDLFTQCLLDITGGGVYEIACGMSYHYRNGTWDSLLQIGEMTGDEAYRNPDELIKRVMQSPFYQKLLPSCIDYYETENYIFTHGWIPCLTDGYGSFVIYEYNRNWRDADATDWRRARWYNGMELACVRHVTEPHKTIVCGHWNCSYGHVHFDHSCTAESGKNADFSPFRADGILAIDACTANSSVVNCVVIED